MKRILVTVPDDLHELMRELAMRKRTSMSKLLLSAFEDAYEDETDAIAGERALAEHLADPDAYVSWNEVKLRLRAQAESSLKRSDSSGTSHPAGSKAVKTQQRRKKVGIQG